MFRRILSSRALSLLVSLFAPPLFMAQATQVKIVGPDTAYTKHDITTTALDLGEMLKATPGYSGSSAFATVLSELSLINSYYHPEKKGPTRTVLDSKSNYLVILQEVVFPNRIPEATFDGVLQMSRRTLNAGSTPLLLMPRGGTLPIATIARNSYRIGNGSGIATVPGGYGSGSRAIPHHGSNPSRSLRKAEILPSFDHGKSEPSRIR